MKDEVVNFIVIKQRLLLFGAMIVAFPKYLFRKHNGTTVHDVANDV